MSQSLDVPLNTPFELVALSQARNYQKWVADTVKPHLGNRIMELGAGLGNMSAWLPVRERLILTESEPRLLEALEQKFAGGSSSEKIKIQSFCAGTDRYEIFHPENLDTIVSFNVLEHVEDDFSAIASLAEILKQSKAPGPKRIVSFVPAHGWAYGGMDESFGHFRRYSTEHVRNLAEMAAPGAKLSYRYFNLVGLVGWVIQGRILGKKEIGLSSIRAFEAICPFVKTVDDWIHKLLKIPLGQSMLFVLTWE